MLQEDQFITSSVWPIFTKVLQVVAVMMVKVFARNNAIALKVHYGDAKKIINFQDILDNSSNEIVKKIFKTKTTISADFSKCPHIHINAFQLHRLMYNLISNPIKYRRVDKNPIIKISSATQQRKPLLKVKDKGIAFDTKLTLRTIFALFRRMYTHLHGFGVGLHRVKSIVRSHRGLLNGSSRPNRGTLFELTI